MTKHVITYTLRYSGVLNVVVINLKNYTFFMAVFVALREQTYQ